MSTHTAAILPQKGSPLEVSTRPTPTPGPNEMLIEIHSIALNPIDYYQRDFGFPPLAHYPAIIGSDVAGTIVSHGASVSSSAPRPGTRITAFCPSFFVQGKPEYGAFQKFALVPEQNVCPLPDSVSFNEGAVMPMAVGTALTGLLYQDALPRDAKFTPADKKGFLVWGGASSVGSAVIQIANLMGFTVYATASKKHHEYLKTLGASKVFDYKSDDVVVSIVGAVKKDCMSLDLGYDAVGSLQECLDVLSECKSLAVAKLASATHITDDSPKREGVEAKFVVGSKVLEERLDHFGWIFGVWLKEKLATGEFVASPKIKIVPGGLEGLNRGLDELRGKVSCLKLVVEI